MADPNIQLPALPSVSVLDDADLYLVRQGLTDKKDTIGSLKTHILADVPTATEATSGKIEIATQAEVNAGVDTTRAVPSAYLKVLIDATIAATKSAVWPIGSVYTNSTDGTNPATLLGFGTWAKYSEGRVGVGHQTGDPLFGTMGATGGSRNAVNVSHTHTMATAGNHRHSVSPAELLDDSGNSFDGPEGSNDADRYDFTNFAGDHTHVINSAGESATNKNLQPYIVEFKWVRTA